jgi:DNA-binding CsgD family transcriptional regulator
MPDLAPLFLMDEVPGSERFENLPWATRWQLTRWLVMMRTEDPQTETLKQTGEALEADLSEALSAYEESQDRFWIVVALATAMFGLLLLTWRQRMQVSRLRREVAESGLVLGPEKLHAIEVIRDAITQGKDINSALVHLSNINDLLTPRQPSMSLKAIGDPALEALNSKEMQLLEHIQRGYSAKEISTLMNVTAGHIYNMRSVVREKLGLDREMDLEEWLKSHSR